MNNLPPDVGVKYVRTEALRWLTDSDARGRLALNRFVGEEDIAFVKTLHDLGAKMVYVLHNGIRFPFPASDSLVVVLPDDRKQRRSLLDIAEAEALLEGFPLERIEDEGQQELGFWWD